jgi:hypothetical protein
MAHASGSPGHQKRHGILGYSNQCHYMKVPGDDGNPASAPEIIDVDANTGPRGFSPAAGQPTNLPNRERIITSPYLPDNGLLPHSFPAYGAPADLDSGSANDLSGAGTSPDGPSNRPTPNSSTTGTSDPQQRTNNLTSGSGGPCHLTSGSGRNSFETSPVCPHQNVGGMSGTTPSDVERNVNADFFGDPPFGIPAAVPPGMTPDQRFRMPTAGGDTPSAATWADMAGQQGMTPVAEGVFRSIMAMGSMDGMEMPWEPAP